MIEDFAKNDKYAAHTGIELVEARPGYAMAKLAVTPNHHNSVGTLHGGALFTLADFAFAAASNSHGRISVAINASISYFKAVVDGIVYAEAKEVSLREKLSSYTIEVKDGKGELVALFQGMTYRKKEAHSFVD